MSDSAATAAGTPSSPTAAATSYVEMHNNEFDQELPPIDFKSDKFPYCIVWTPIFVLTWFFPFIGHMGKLLTKFIAKFNLIVIHSRNMHVKWHNT